MSRRSSDPCFNSQWEDFYFFVNANGKALSLICHTTVNINASTVRRHYDNKHAVTHDGIVGSERTELIHKLKLELPQNEVVSHVYTCHSIENIEFFFFLMNSYTCAFFPLNFYVQT